MCQAEGMMASGITEDRQCSFVAIKKTARKLAAAAAPRARKLLTNK